MAGAGEDGQDGPADGLDRLPAVLVIRENYDGFLEGAGAAASIMAEA